MKNNNYELAAEIKEAIEVVEEKLLFISDNWNDTLNANYPFGLDLQEVTARISEWGMAVDKEFRGDDSLLTTVGKILVEFSAEGRYLIYGSTEYDYTAEDVINHLTPMFNSEKCSYDVSFIEDRSSVVLSIY